MQGTAAPCISWEAKQLNSFLLSPKGGEQLRTAFAPDVAGPCVLVIVFNSTAAPVPGSAAAEMRQYSFLPTGSGNSSAVSASVSAPSADLWLLSVTIPVDTAIRPDLVVAELLWSATVTAAVTLRSRKGEPPVEYCSREVRGSLVLRVFPSQRPLADETVAATRGALLANIVLSAVSGPDSASDVQAMVLLTVARCSVSSTKAAASTPAGAFKMITPFALSDTASGALAGNAIAFAAVVVLQLCAFAVFRLGLGRALVDAGMSSRCPGFAVLLAASVHQSTTFVAIRLLGGEAGEVAAGAAALLLVTIGLPVGLVVAALRVPRRFAVYDVDSSSVFSRNPLALLRPCGVVCPRSTRLMASPVLTAFTSPSPFCVVMPFVSSAAANVPCLLPATAPGWACSGAMYISSVVHLALGMACAVLRLHRYPSSRVLSATGYFCIAAFHAQLASGWTNGINQMIMAQAAISMLRSVACVVVTVLEDKMQKDAANVRLGEVLWVVGSGGTSDCTLPERNLLSLPDTAECGVELTALPLAATRGDAAPPIGEAPSPWRCSSEGGPTNANADASTAPARSDAFQRVPVDNLRRQEQIRRIMLALVPAADPATPADQRLGYLVEAACWQRGLDWS